MNRSVPLGPSPSLAFVPPANTTSRRWAPSRDLLRVIVRYDPSFSRPGTFILAPQWDGIRARFKLGAADELVITAELRWLRPRHGENVYIHPIDAAGTTWLTEASTFGGQVGVPVELQLNDCSEYAADALRLL